MIALALLVSACNGQSSDGGSAVALSADPVPQITASPAPTLLDGTYTHSKTWCGNSLVASSSGEKLSISGLNMQVFTTIGSCGLVQVQTWTLAYQPVSGTLTDMTQQQTQSISYPGSCTPSVAALNGAPADYKYSFGGGFLMFEDVTTTCNGSGGRYQYVFVKN